jgi:RNA polymerase sigma factor (sigma-70 family)
MNALHDKTANIPISASPSDVGGTIRSSTGSDFTVHPRGAARAATQIPKLKTRPEQWGPLMVAAQRGESEAYEQLLRRLDVWLSRYYALRLPHSAAEDARQEALLTVHAKRHTYVPSRPFGAWIAAIARYKWLAHLRDTSRFATVLLSDELAAEDRTEATESAIMVNDLLKRLKPAQARVIRLVKLQGVSINDASVATGQSASLVKVNIHRGLKKLAVLAASSADTTTICAKSPRLRNSSSNPPVLNRFSVRRLRDPAVG